MNSRHTLICAIARLSALLLVSIPATAFALAGDAPLLDPLGGATLGVLVNRVIGALIRLATPVMVVGVVYSGFKLVMAQGNPTEIGKAQESLKYTLIGSAIILGAYIIQEVLRGTIESIVGK